jgi:hypothetical protein
MKEEWERTRVQTTDSTGGRKRLSYRQIEVNGSSTCAGTSRGLNSTYRWCEVIYERPPSRARCLRV